VYCCDLLSKATRRPPSRLTIRPAAVPPVRVVVVCATRCHFCAGICSVLSSSWNHIRPNKEDPLNIRCAVGIVKLPETHGNSLLNAQASACRVVENRPFLEWNVSAF